VWGHHAAVVRACHPGGDLAGAHAAGETPRVPPQNGGACRAVASAGLCPCSAHQPGRGLSCCRRGRARGCGIEPWLTAARHGDVMAQLSLALSVMDPRHSPRALCRPEGVSGRLVSPSCPCGVRCWLWWVGEGAKPQRWVAADAFSLPTALLYKPIDRVTRSTLVLHVSVAPVPWQGTVGALLPLLLGTRSRGEKCCGGSLGWVLQAGQCPCAAHPRLSPSRTSSSTPQPTIPTTRCSRTPSASRRTSSPASMRTSIPGGQRSPPPRGR